MPTLARLTGTGTAGAWLTTTPWDRLTRARAQVLKDTLDLLMASDLPKNLYVGGTELTGIPATSTGDKTLYDFVPWLVDNRGTRISGFTDANGASIVVQVRFLVRVSNAAINVTPKIWYASSLATLISGPSAATVSGTAACSATASDYSGANQSQTVALTLPSGANYFKCALTVAGTVDPAYQVWGRAFYDAYVSLP